MNLTEWRLQEMSHEEPDDHQTKRGGRNDFLCNILERQEVNEGLKSNDIKLG